MGDAFPTIRAAASSKNLSQELFVGPRSLFSQFFKNSFHFLRRTYGGMMGVNLTQVGRLIGYLLKPHGHYARIGDLQSLQRCPVPRHADRQPS